MMNTRIWIAVVCVILIVLLYCSATYHQSTYEQYMTGYWVASNDEFCDSAGVTSILLYLNNPNTQSSLLKQSRDGYLIITDDVCNQPITITYKRGWANPSLSKYHVYADITFSCEDVMDSRVEICVDMMAGQMIIKNDTETFAKLYKQHEITQLTNDDVTR